MRNQTVIKIAIDAIVLTAFCGFMIVLSIIIGTH
jgi:hypothetical protein